MRKFLAGTVALCMVAVGCHNANADDATDWKAQFTGLDGVAVSCVRNLERKYTGRICKTLMDHITARLKKLGIAHEELGTSYRRDATPPKAEALKAPLHLTVLVRATNPNPLGIDVRLNATVAYRAAVEQGGTTPRTGHLLIWQNGLTGAGPRKQLEKAATKVARERVDLFLEHIERNWAR